MQNDIEMFVYKEEVDMEAWINNPDPDFADMNKKSRVPPSWKSFQQVLMGKYGKSIIKPINMYSQVMCDPPSLISIENNTVRLRQNNYAEIYLIDPTERDWPRYQSFDATDRPWIRQFYNTVHKRTPPPDCYNETFLLYTPWFIDENVQVRYERVEEETPFFIYPTVDIWRRVDRQSDYVAPHFIPFHFKRVGDHMHDENFGIVRENSPMYDMVFSANDIIIKNIKEFYEYN